MEMETPVAIVVIVYTCLFFIGFTGNILMVIVTIISKELRSVCNLLIGFCCFSEALLFTNLVAFVYSSFAPMPQDLCFYLLIPADFGALASNGLVLMIGIDRLIAVASPVRYKILEMNRVKYLVALLAFPVLYALIHLYIAAGERDPSRNVNCVIPVSLGSAYHLFALSSFFMDLFVPPIYIYVYFRLKRMKSNNSIRSVFKSLFITVVIVICGWTTTDLIGVLTIIIPMDRHLAIFIQLSCGVFILSASASNVFVYYKLSRDYRIALRSLLRLKTNKRTPATVRDFTDSKVIPRSSGTPRIVDLQC